MKNTTAYLNVLLSVAILLLCIKLVSLSAPANATATTATTTDSTMTADQPMTTTADSTMTQAPTPSVPTDGQPVTADVTKTGTTAMASLAEPAAKTATTAPAAKAMKAAPAEKAPAVRVINTTDLGKDIIGYAGPTPLEITIEDGKVKSIKALPNQESPGFLKKVLRSGLLERWNGKTVDEAKDMDVDAVTGATFTSTAMIKTVRKALRQ